MMRLMLLILLISANCMKMNCGEESIATESKSEISEKSKILPTDPESLQSRAENVESENEESKAVDGGEDIRVSRSSSGDSTRNEAQFDDSSQAHSTEVSITEKTAPHEEVIEIERQADKEVEEAKSRTDSTEALEDNTRSAEHVEKQLEELPKISRSAVETEDRKAEDLLEASAESRLSGNENASSKVDETGRSSEIEKIKGISDESGLKESLETRRTPSIPDHVVIETKMRADTTSTAVEPEVKTAFNQSLNTYNNFNEFGTDSDIKLTDSSPMEPTTTVVKTSNNIPVNTQLASQEMLNQQYYPKFYPRPELNINFPNINSDFQGPRDLPIYLKVKQDEYQLKNQFIGAQQSQFKSTEDNTQFNPRTQQQYHQSQNIHDTPGTVINTQFENIPVGRRNYVPRYYNMQVPTNLENFIGNKQSMNVNHDSRNEVQQFYQNQEKTHSNFKQFGNLNREPRNQVEEAVKSKMPSNSNNQANQYPLLDHSEGIFTSNINLNNKQFGTERLANPYSYLQPKPQQINALNGPYNSNIIPTKIKILFQKLASASEFPNRLPTTLYNNDNIQHYPHFISPNFKGDFSFYDLSYIPEY